MCFIEILFIMNKSFSLASWCLTLKAVVFGCDQAVHRTYIKKITWNNFDFEKERLSQMDKNWVFIVIELIISKYRCVLISLSSFH